MGGLSPNTRHSTLFPLISLSVVLTILVQVSKRGWAQFARSSLACSMQQAAEPMSRACGPPHRLDHDVLSKEGVLNVNTRMRQRLAMKTVSSQDAWLELGPGCATLRRSLDSGLSQRCRLLPHGVLHRCSQLLEPGPVRVGSGHAHPPHQRLAAHYRLQRLLVLMPAV